MGAWKQYSYDVSGTLVMSASEQRRRGGAWVVAACEESRFLTDKSDGCLVKGVCQARVTGEVWTALKNVELEQQTEEPDYINQAFIMDMFA